MENIRANQNNVVSALVHATVSNVTLMAVEFGLDSLHLQTTPAVPTVSDSVTLPVLGLIPNTTYFIRIVAFSATGASTQSGFRQFVTDSLPSDIPKLSKILSTDPSPGYVMLGFNSPATARSYAAIIDNDARIVMYRAFDGPVGDFQKQPNGHYTTYSSLNGNTSRFYEFDASGTILREYQALGADETDVHELRLLGSGSNIGQLTLLHVEVS